MMSRMTRPRLPSRRRVRASAALALLLGAPAAAAPVKNPGVFVYAIVGDAESLDPHWQYDGISAFADDQMYEGLVGYKGERTDVFEPRLSTEVPTRANGLLSADGRTYAFPIRRGVLFHDGTPLEPEDARYSLLRSMLQDRVGGSGWLLLESILGVESTRGPDGKPDPSLYARAAKAVRVEDGRLVVTLKRPFAPFLSVLCTYGYVLSRRWAAAHGDWDGREETWLRFNNPDQQSTAFFGAEDGTGPFRLARWDRGAQEIVLERAEKYWRAPARLKRVVLRTVPEFETRKLLLQAGDADAIFADGEYLPQLKALLGVDVRDDLPLAEVHDVFLFNLKTSAAGNRYIGSGRLDGDGVPPDFFADKDVRLGFAYAFPYARFLSDVYRDRGTQARGPIPRGMTGFDPASPVYFQDPAQARAHFSRAFGGEVWKRGFRLSCVYEQGQQTRAQACAILKSAVESLNPRFRLDAYGLQWSTFLAQEDRGALPLVNVRWGLDYADPHNAVFPFLHSAGIYAKPFGYANPEADRLIERAAAERDPVERARLYRRLVSIAHDDAAQLFTVDTGFVRAARRGIRGFGYNPIQPYGTFYTVEKD
jgi:peptide/nickel transport system substrate-binding protein